MSTHGAGWPPIGPGAALWGCPRAPGRRNSYVWVPGDTQNDEKRSSRNSTNHFGHRHYLMGAARTKQTFLECCGALLFQAYSNQLPNWYIPTLVVIFCITDVYFLIMLGVRAQLATRCWCLAWLELPAQLVGEWLATSHYAHNRAYRAKTHERLGFLLTGC